jgi:uncharacterized protein DUF4244
MPIQPELETRTNPPGQRRPRPRPRPHIALLTAVRRRHERRHDDRGQATSEYALVILVAAGIAVGVIAWAGDTDSFTRLFDTVVDHLTSDL